MKNVRIVKRTFGDGRVYYFYQVEHKRSWKKKWVDYRPWYNYNCLQTYDTLEEAQKNIWRPQEIEPIDEIIGGEK
jgi:hypothetical protein